MAMFDWVPYLQGKYLTYYQFFAAFASTIALTLSFLSFFLYLILCKITTTITINKKGQQKLLKRQNSNKIIEKLKNASFNAGFIFLSLVPLILSALDVIYLVAGMLGMMGVYLLQAYMNNGRRNWTKMENDENSTQSSIFESFVSKARKMNPRFKKNIKKAILVSIIAPLFAYKTCLCFYN